MKSIKMFVIAFLITLFISTGFVQNVKADDFKFTVDNRTKQDVTVRLKGNKNYVLEVDEGHKASKEIEEGKYWVTYSVCGTDYDWKLKLEKNYTLTLYPCQHQPTKIQVKSHLSEDVVLNLEGYKDYEIDIDPGKTKVNVYSGNMSYQYEACDGQVFAGEFWVAKNGTTQLILHSCEWHLSPARTYGQPNPVKFRVVNHASFSVILSLIGPENYLVTANPGINVYTLVSGSYRYSYYQDNALITGSMVVTKNGVGVLVITPSHVLEFVDDSGDLE